MTCQFFEKGLAMQKVKYAQADAPLLEQIGRRARQVVAVAMTAAMMSLSVVPSALALSAPNEQNTGAGTTANPYVLSVTASDYTRPSAFWGQTNNTNSVVGWSGIRECAVVFDSGDENYSSKMFFDMTVGNGNGIHVGKAAYGPLYSGLYKDIQGGIAGSNSSVAAGSLEEAADVWNGSWTYAFRLCPYTTFKDVDNNGTADKLAFNWKGCFGTYFDKWTYSFDASAALGATSGQTVTLSYYGDYDANQTSRGTDYTVDFDSTTTSLAYSGYTTSDTPVGYSVSAVVDDDGIVSFTNGVRYGGNYNITVS